MTTIGRSFIAQNFALRHENPHRRALVKQAVKIIQNQKRYWRNHAAA